MNTLPVYKGFQASVDYDDGVLLIRLLHIDDAISATCTSTSDVEKAFHDLVDDYLETCSELGEEPNRPFKGSFNVRVDPALHRDAAIAAATNEQSLNAWVEEAISEKLRREIAEKSYLIREQQIPVHRNNEEAGTWTPDAVVRMESDIVVLQAYRAMSKKKIG